MAAPCPPPTPPPNPLEGLVNGRAPMSPVIANISHTKGIGGGGVGEGVRARWPLAPSPITILSHFQGTDELGEEAVYRGGDVVAFPVGNHLGV